MRAPRERAPVIPALLLVFALAPLGCETTPPRRGPDERRESPDRPREAPERPAGADPAPKPAEPAAKPPAGTPEPSSLEQQIESFRRYVYAYYESLVYAERARKIKEKGTLDERGHGAQLAVLKDRVSRAREQLAGSLGLPVSARLGPTMARFRSAIKARRDLAILPDPSAPALASLGLVRIDDAKTRSSTLTLNDESITVERRTVTEVLVDDYSSYRAALLGRPRPFRGLVVVETQLYLRPAEIDAFGEERFWSKLEFYRRVGRTARNPKSFDVLKNRPPELLVLAKDELRRRSLEPIVLAAETRGTAERARLFREALVRQAELRAALALTGERARAGTEAAARRATQRHLRLMEEGDPFSALATIFGLTLQSTAGARNDETEGARRATRLLLASAPGLWPLDESLTGAAAEARWVHAMARAEVEDLRTLAAAALARLKAARK